MPSRSPRSQLRPTKKPCPENRLPSELRMQLGDGAGEHFSWCDWDILEESLMFKSNLVLHGKVCIG